MTVILLTRHGHVQGIKPECFRGRADLLLTEEGRTQAQLLAKRIARRWLARCIYTSPLSRCVETGASIAETCNIPSIPLSGLNDLDYGTWQSLTYAQAREKNPDLFAKWFAAPHSVAFPRGESLQEVAARTAAALRSILSEYESDTVVIVGHDSINRVILTQLLDLPLSSYWKLVQDPCCINEIEINNAAVRVKRMNDISHLES
jgi:probable phosphoglycerate mutase